MLLNAKVIAFGKVTVTNIVVAYEKDFFHLFRHGNSISISAASAISFTVTDSIHPLVFSLQLYGLLKAWEHGTHDKSLL